MTRNLVIVLMMSIASFLQAQERNIKTQSVEIDNLISFVVENYKAKQSAEEQSKNIIFLIQFNNDFSEENKVILRQSLKLVTSRLTDDDKISILTYSGVNGVVLKQTNPTKVKKILNSIVDFNVSIKEMHKDGIDFAYKYANNHFDEDVINSILMIRNPNATAVSSNQKQSKKKKNNAVLLTALSLLPEVLAVLKN